MIYLSSPAIIRSGDMTIDLPKGLRHIGRVARLLVGGGFQCLAKKPVSTISHNI